MFRHLCTTAVEPDGLLFDPESVRTIEIREGHHYDGARVTLMATLSSARISLQIDVGFGDAVTPAAPEASYPTLLDLPAPRLRVYPIETVIAEKLEALILLGIANSRMKDFYDLAYIARHYELSSGVLAEAVRATFERRRTELPAVLPLGLSSTFAEDPEKMKQWAAFVRRLRLTDQSDLVNTVALVRQFLWPIIEIARTASMGPQRAPMLWLAGGPWTEI